MLVADSLHANYTTETETLLVDKKGKLMINCIGFCRVAQANQVGLLTKTCTQCLPKGPKITLTSFQTIYHTPLSTHHTTNRPGVAKAVIQTPSSLINSLNN